MVYKRIDDHEIEISPGQIAINRVLQCLAKMSYESAGPPRSDFLRLLDREADTVDFSAFIHLDGPEMLDMDFVHGRNCKTKVRKSRDGRYIFDARLYQTSGRHPETLLDKVQAALEKDTEQAQSPTRSGEKKLRRGLVEVLSELILELFS